MACLRSLDLAQIAAELNECMRQIRADPNAMLHLHPRIRVVGHTPPEYDAPNPQNTSRVRQWFQGAVRSLTGVARRDPEGTEFEVRADGSVTLETTLEGRVGRMLVAKATRVGYAGQHEGKMVLVFDATFDPDFMRGARLAPLEWVHTDGTPMHTETA
jgi:hypothetical protein